MSSSLRPSERPLDLGHTPRVLVVDDEQGLRDMLSILLRREGYDVSIASSFTTGVEAALGAPTPFDLVLTDLMMPDGSGLDVLSRAKARSENTEVIVMTAYGDVETAIDAMKRGAYDFVTKPFATSELRALARKALERRALATENEKLRAQVERGRPAGILGHSAAMRRVLDLVNRVVDGKTTVLVTGESGTGKERIARAIHERSERKDKPFLVVNCGAIPEELMESELFGHEKGAFTGATQKQLGIFRAAEGGTVLLDEVGELPPQLQVKLLRVLQERKVRGVGASQETPIDVRVLAATNRNVEQDVKDGKFRQDLYYRLNVIRIELPPLRERREDIPEIADYLLHRCAAEHKKEIVGFSPDVMRALDAYDFPGNVRELENVVERAVALARASVIGLGDLPREVVGGAASPSPELFLLPEEGCDLDQVLGEAERRLILQALERTGGVRVQAAKLLHVSLRSLRYRLQKLGVATEEDNAAANEEEPSH
ncbi:MAG TPA: sigma-54 dependent transcriptional regulator [Polyangiaceae bacterium]